MHMVIPPSELPTVQGHASGSATSRPCRGTWLRKAPRSRPVLKHSITCTHSSPSWELCSPSSRPPCTRSWWVVVSCMWARGSQHPLGHWGRASWWQVCSHVGCAAVLGRVCRTLPSTRAPAGSYSSVAARLILAPTCRSAVPVDPRAEPQRREDPPRHDLLLLYDRQHGG